MTAARRANGPRVLGVSPCEPRQVLLFRPNRDFLLFGLADYAHKELSALEKNIWDSSRAQSIHMGQAESSCRGGRSPSGGQHPKSVRRAERGLHLRVALEPWPNTDRGTVSLGLGSAAQQRPPAWQNHQVSTEPTCSTLGGSQRTVGGFLALGSSPGPFLSSTAPVPSLPICLHREPRPPPQACAAVFFEHV